jgi:integrase
MNLTRTSIDGISLPKGKKDAIFWDDTLPGFGLRIRAGGSRKWVVQYVLHGHQPRRVTIGSVAVFSPEEARKAAREILAKARLGQDTQEQRREEDRQSRLTLRALIDQYLAERGPRLRPRTRSQVERYLLRRWEPLHRTPASKIARRDVAALLKGPQVAAARARAALSALFVWAIKAGLADANPCIGTGRPDEDIPARERVLTDGELTAVWRACGDDEYGRIVKLLICTGARRDEIGALRWSELDMERGIWVLPVERSKNKRAHTLPLPELAWSIIASVPRMASRDYLFGVRAVGFQAWSRNKIALDAALGDSVTPFVLHDLRRTVATRMADLGVQPHIIEAVLNHVSGHRRGVAGIYNRSSYEREVRTALAMWADRLQSLIDGGERRIIPLRG